MSVQHVEVIYHQEEDSWWAESPSVEGYSAANDSLDVLRREVREGLAFFLDEEVEVDERFENAPRQMAIVSLKVSGLDFAAGLVDSATSAAGRWWVTKHQLHASVYDFGHDRRTGAMLHGASH